MSTTVAKMEVLCFRLPGHGDATLKSMNSLRSRQQFCDITIVASGRQTFRGHKVVLAACSPFLRDQFLLNPSSELQVSVLHSSSVVCELLQSCYTGVLQFSPKEIVNYLTAASYLQMEHVVEKCRGALGKYMQPRNPSSPKIKSEESHSMPVTVSGSSQSLMSTSIDHSPSLQPHSPVQSQVDDHTDSHTKTDIRHDDEHNALDEIKVRVTEEGECRDDYDMIRMCMEGEQELEERREVEEGGEDATEGHQGGQYPDTDSVIVGGGEGDDVTPDEMAIRISSFEREGLRAWRRRLTDSPKVGRGRGFKRKRGSYHERERRPLGMQYQEAWRMPTGAEMMQSFGLDFSQEATRSAFPSGSELPRLDYGMGDSQGEELVPRDGNGPVHYSPDDPSGDGGEGNMGMSAVPTGGDEAGDESVAVVGSTSSTAGPVACEQCGLTFPSAHYLAVHSRATHLLYVCPCCGKHFNHSSNLNRHMTVHRGAKVHRCQLCDKTFTQKSTLCDHMNLHSGERPHCCAYCHSRFAHKPALRRHLKEQHGKTTAQNSLEAQAEMERVAGEGEGDTQDRFDF
ncbi:zinc finger and BTB domain-containing protein 12-like isoform X1 [Oncorhynchus kisutch]|nr:zinc finger and BTB domain-containing protein 12-like isoform X1 [Oncorhynchus kisutch]